jgi:hypothetical protein
MDIHNLIKSLENGVCPAELLYKPNAEITEFDWDRVLYNLRYHDPSFYDNKFPSEIKQIPAYDQIIDLIVDKNKDNSPLKEIIERNNVNKEYEMVSTEQEHSVCKGIYSEGDCK